MTDANGLASCKICGVITKRSYEDFNGHYMNAHGTSLVECVKKFERVSLQQTAREEDLSWVLTGKLACPMCGKEEAGGLEGLRTHYRAAHRRDGRGRPGYINVTRTLGFLSGSLGLSRCGKCGGATFPEAGEWHRANCKRRIREGGNISSKNIESKEKGRRFERAEEVKDEAGQDISLLGEEPKREKRNDGDGDSEEENEADESTLSEQEVVQSPLKKKEKIMHEKTESENEKSDLLSKIKASVLMPKCPWCIKKFESANLLRSHAKDAHGKGNWQSFLIVPCNLNEFIFLFRKQMG